MSDAFPSIGVLISGRGSNLQALIDATRDGTLRASIRVVVSNRAGAAGLAKAEAAGIETVVLPNRSVPTRDAYDAALVELLRERGVRLVCLAGFMRLLGTPFCAAFAGAALNVHPSLLPAFPGIDAQSQALAYGVKVAGATVHLVTPDLDAGPIVAQGTVPVLETDSAETLSARVLAVEHRIYPPAVQRVLNGGWTVVGRRVRFP